MKSNRLTISLLFLLFVIYPPSLSQSRNQVGRVAHLPLERPVATDKKIDSLLEKLDEAGDKLERSTKALMKKLDTLKRIKND